MRIISGAYKGRQLATPKDLSVRPTTDKVRNAVFSMLFDAVDDAAALDLFAGTGSYGLEALSRGAASAVFADVDVQFVKMNLKGLEELNTEVIKGDVLKILPSMNRAFDIIFIDPPYGEVNPNELLALIKHSKILANHGVVVYEESIRSVFDITVEGFRIDSEKRYGDTVIRIISQQNEGDL